MASSHLSTSAFGSVQEFGTNMLNTKLLKPLDEVLRCQICFGYFTDCLITKCSHNYCSVCIRRYMNYKSQCPTCFQVATEPELQNNRLVDEILRIYMKIRDSLHVPVENVDISFPEQSSSSKPTINKSLSETKEAGTSNNNNSTQQNEDLTSDEVSCPVCYTTVPSSRINIHLDTCLKQTEERNQRKFLPKLVYHLMNDKDIKKKLKDHGLSTTGDRQALIRRHKNFITLFNANCDSLNPKPVSELLLEIERQELEERLSTAQKSIQTNKRSDPSEIDKEHESYLEEHRSQFNALIQDVQERALAERHIKQEVDNIEVTTSNITDESGNVIGKSTFSVRNDPVLVKVEPVESVLDDPVIIKEEPPESLYEDPYMSHNQSNISSMKNTICDNESEKGMEYINTGCNKSSQLPFRVKKDVPVLKIKDEPQFLLDPIPNQENKADSPSSIDDFETSKTVPKMARKKLRAAKKGSRQNWQEEDMLLAIQSVYSKTKSLNTAARTYNVPKSTLSRKLKQFKSTACTVVRNKLGRKPIFSEELEDQLVKYCLEMEKKSHKLTKSHIRRMAFQLAEKNGIPNPFNNKIAGRGWFDHFLNRNKDKLSKIFIGADLIENQSEELTVCSSVVSTTSDDSLTNEIPPSFALQNEIPETAFLTAVQSPSVSPYTEAIQNSLTSTSSELILPHDISSVPKIENQVSNINQKTFKATMLTSSSCRNSLKISLLQPPQTNAPAVPQEKVAEENKKTDVISQKNSCMNFSNINQKTNAKLGRSQRAKRKLYSKQKESNNKRLSEEDEKSINSACMEEDIPKSPVQKDAECLICTEKISTSKSGELSVICTMCQGWAHVLCSGCETEVYLCDFCKDKRPSNRHHKKKNARKLSTEEKNSQRKK